MQLQWKLHNKNKFFTSIAPEKESSSGKLLKWIIRVSLSVAHCDFKPFPNNICKAWIYGSSQCQQKQILSWIIYERWSFLTTNNPSGTLSQFPIVRPIRIIAVSTTDLGEHPSNRQVTLLQSNFGWCVVKYFKTIPFPFDFQKNQFSSSWFKVPVDWIALDKRDVLAAATANKTTAVWHDCFHCFHLKMRENWSNSLSQTMGSFEFHRHPDCISKARPYGANYSSLATAHQLATQNWRKPPLRTVWIGAKKQKVCLFLFGAASRHVPVFPVLWLRSAVLTSYSRKKKVALNYISLRACDSMWC